jgi:hypothetical protein
VSEDARFADGAERPLRLRAEAEEDLVILSSVLQDAVTRTGDIAWMPRRHRFTLLVNRFRGEDAAAAERQGREFERVRALLRFDGALRARSDGIDPADRDTVLSLLDIAFVPEADGGGRVRLVFAGDGEIALDVECLDVTLTDVTRPYAARATTVPTHRPD